MVIDPEFLARAKMLYDAQAAAPKPAAKVPSYGFKGAKGVPSCVLFSILLHFPFQVMAKAKASIGRSLSPRRRNGASRASAAGVRGARISDLATMSERPRMVGKSGSARGLDT